MNKPAWPGTKAGAVADMEKRRKLGVADPVEKGVRFIHAPPAKSIFQFLQYLKRTPACKIAENMTHYLVEPYRQLSELATRRKVCMECLKENTISSAHSLWSLTFHCAGRQRAEDILHHAVVSIIAMLSGVEWRRLPWLSRRELDGRLPDGK